MYPQISVLIVVLLLLVASCRQAGGVAGPLIQATPTPTPRSTPLPPVATVLPPGIEENPIRMVIRPAVRSLVTDFQIGQFENALLEEVGLVVDVTVVERYAEALAALCESTPGQVTVAWLDGLSYQAALARNCGSPALRMERGNQSGEVVRIVTGDDSSVNNIQALRGQTYCRLGYNDYYTWLIPSLLMQANGIDPLSIPVVDYPDIDDLMAAVAEGECSAAAIAESDFDDLSGTLRGELRTITETPPLPYGVLLYPINLPLGERLRLDDGLLALTTNREMASLVEPLLGVGRAVRADRSDFDALGAFLDDTRLDFAQLGN